jgi:hypothetical protein
MKTTLASAISDFGTSARQKLANPSTSGEPEDQIRTPFEQLLKDMADLSGFLPSHITAVGETSLSDLKTRPDYSITVQNALVGFVELKAPGKGADPRRFRDAHDKSQWEKLRSLPNLLYSDGNQFSLWQNGELVDAVVILDGDIASSGDKLTSPETLLSLFSNFFRWKPIPPRNARELAHTSALLCRLLRDEVIEQLALGSPALTSLAADWRKLLFPDATDERFADGYAQAVTFGLLMARAKNIPLADGLHRRMGRVPETRRPFLLRRLRRHARPHLGDCSRRPIPRKPLEKTHSRKEPGGKRETLPSAHARRKTWRQTQRQSSHQTVARFPRLNHISGGRGQRFHQTRPLRFPILRPPVDHSRYSRDQSGESRTLVDILRSADFPNCSK